MRNSHLPFLLISNNFTIMLRIYPKLAISLAHSLLPIQASSCSHPTQVFIPNSDGDFFIAYVRY
jgi:hypothetical protein